jgi:hypothetical protein
MSASDYTLTVRAADAAAEIAAFDGSLNSVAKGVGELRAELPRGIYKIRVRVGPSFEEQLVSLDQDRQLTIGALAFASPIPLAGTSRSHEYHQSAAVDCSRTTRATFGSGASILVFAREWSVTGDRSQSNPAAGLTLCSEAGEPLAVVADQAELHTQGDASAGWRADVAPGAYRLRLVFSDGSGLERPLFATPGMQTQIFLLQRDQTLRDGKTERRADLATATVTISPRQWFNPQDRRTRLSELASYALTQSRRILSDAVLSEILDEKFEDPMLGLLGAHLILHDDPGDLRDNPTRLRQFQIVTQNLQRLLGPDHPDLRALWWRRGDTSSIGDGRLHSLPMLRRSWDLAVSESFKNPEAIALQGPSSGAVVGILPTAPWLLWRVDDQAEAASTDSGALSDALGDYLRARSRAAALRASQLMPEANQSADQEGSPAPARSSKRVRPKTSAAKTSASKAPAPKTSEPKTAASEAPASETPTAKRATSKKAASKKSAAKKARPRSLQQSAAPPSSSSASLESAAVKDAAPTSVTLGHEEKADIARTLGVPSQVLEAMLRKFSS